MIDATEVLFALAVRIQANQRSAMSATILERIDLAVGVSRDDDRGFADLGGAEIAGLAEFAPDGLRVMEPAEAPFVPRG